MLTPCDKCMSCYVLCTCDLIYLDMVCGLMWLECQHFPSLAACCCHLHQAAAHGVDAIQGISVKEQIWALYTSQDLAHKHVYTNFIDMFSFVALYTASLPKVVASMTDWAVSSDWNVLLPVPYSYHSWDWTRTCSNSCLEIGLQHQTICKGKCRFLFWRQLIKHD